MDWSKALWHLPVQDILKAVDGPRGIFSDSMPVSTGGRMIQRAPNDPAWYKGGLYHDNMPLNVPGLWYMSWYHLSVGPNLALFNHVRKTASADVASQQWAVIAPVGHCAYTRATENTVVGERSMGDARLDYAELTYGFFDRFLKGEKREKNRHARYAAEGYVPHDGFEQVAGVRYLAAARRAADDLLPRKRRQGEYARWRWHPDDVAACGEQARLVHLRSDEPSDVVGGNVCCTGTAITAGSFDQRKMETRPDILVYTSTPFAEGVEISGPIEPTLYVSSDAKDTDFTVKVLDVYPDGRAYNLDESIQRMRYRDGYDKPLVWMNPARSSRSRCSR